MTNRYHLWLPRFAAAIVLLATGLTIPLAHAAGGGHAHGKPGDPGTWTNAAKMGIGTSYEAYSGGQFSNTAPTGPVSKVWFSIARGIVTETAHGLIHQNQLRDLQFLVTGPGFFHEEKTDTDHAIEYLVLDNAATARPVAPAYRVVNTDRQAQPRYAIEKHVFTDPDRQTLFVHVIFRAFANGITPFVLANPYIDSTYGGDFASVSSDGLFARNAASNKHLALRSNTPFTKTSAGFVGRSDGWQDLNDNRVMDWVFDSADDGNVAVMAQLGTLNAGDTLEFDIAVGFGGSQADARAQADGSLAEGHAALLDKYAGTGNAVGWRDYLDSLSGLPAMIPATADNGRLLHASALVLKSLEDKSNAGALIASGSIPWGETVSAEFPATGYRAVWPRDFYQCAMALLALGDTKTPLVALDYLPKVQVLSNVVEKDGVRIETQREGWEPNRPGWFLQKTHVDGVIEWIQVQMDQTAMPVMLGWQLWKRGLLSDADITQRYWSSLKPAAEFLANGGTVKMRFSGGNTAEYTIDPPWTKQERWEEEEGYSPSTTGAIVAGLVSAAEIARKVGGGEVGAAQHYEGEADAIVDDLTRSMFTTNGGIGNGRYYVRIDLDAKPDNGGTYDINSCANASNPQVCKQDERAVLDPGFLELVRYGVRKADNSAIMDSLPEIDDLGLSDDQRVRYRFTAGTNTFDGFRRYSFDRYGERTDNGSNYAGDDFRNRGRVWPILTGERGHYVLAAALRDGSLSPAEEAEVKTYVAAMEHFANEGLMLPEQVWDGVGSNATHNFTIGEGTESATPLAWSHAEYVKLVKSFSDRQVWDANATVSARYDTVP